MSALINNEVQKIQNILGKTQNVVPRDELSHYTPLEKCFAILNWKDETGSYFDTSFVESLYLQLGKSGTITDKQLKSLDRILVQCSIEVSEYL